MPTTLGFAEAVDDESARDLFPSKIGGKPRWLDPTCPLAADRVLCDECSRPMGMLMQLSAPEDEPADAFHRMLYVFICRNGACHQAGAQRCMRVFRSQLSEDNAIYKEQELSTAGSGDEDNDEDGIEWVLAKGVDPAPLCAVCGLRGDKACSRCHQRRYCSRAHQLVDWDYGHNAQCTDGAGQADEAAAHKQKLLRLVYPEHVIASEEEEGEESGRGDGSDDEGSEDDAEAVQGAAAVVPATGEAAEDSHVEVDPAFLSFQRRVSRNPEQVIRYARVPGVDEPEEPLFVSDAGRPVEGVDVADCEQCGAARQFEFQVMPQMLNYLALDSVDPKAVDWGTILVYTCPRSCSASGGGTGQRTYTREVACRQNFSSHGIGQNYIRAMHGDDGAFNRQFDSLGV
ncbi:hypothetical protein GGF46_002440 [Coemansia sp. RSA 552]|nr:hypothetical protein GGF46_002440 [Coemansia sp. RSA 552]